MTNKRVDVPCGISMVGHKEGNYFNLKIDGIKVVLHKDKCIVLAEMFN